MHGTFQSNGGVPAQPPRALGPSGAPGSAPSAGSSTKRGMSPLPGDDPRAKSYIEG